MNTNFNIDSDSLIHNPEFFEWVVRPTKESDQYWALFISANPSRKKKVEEAIFIIKSIIPKEKELTEEAMIRLWNRIENGTKSRGNYIFRFSGWKVAASVILLLGLSGLIYFQLNQPDTTDIDYLSIAKVKAPDNEVKLIFADKSEEVFISKDLDIKYNSKGEIEVNSDKRLTQKIQELKSETEQLNQLVVPRGKRTSLTLSDGTKLWLNSGSRAIFPVIFTKKEREIFIEGEAYLEVAHDLSKPFFVVTNKIHVRVLGTKFNVSAYPDDPITSVILVEGSIQATVDSKKMVMKPNQLLTYEKNSCLTALKETDVLPFTSWKDGWMYCEKEKLETIATKLSRYYNVQIEFKDTQAKEMTLTGKLDLKTECSEIFKAISSTAPISFEIQNDVIVISKKSIN
ncbi:MAG TPA: hypothetical protein DCR40_13990 [Prolixibacteraceae bacterium]|nr:hypothetical protein [Prolixibacteraceae bacterium]